MSDTNAQQSPKTVSKIAYALLAFFFGGISNLRYAAADLPKIGGAKLQKIKKSLRLAFSFWFGKQ